MVVIGFYSTIIYKSIKNNEQYNAFKKILSEVAQNTDLKLLFYTPSASYDCIYQSEEAIFKNIALLVKNEKLELLSGSFYQSLLSFLPNKYKSSHIEESNNYIKKNFKKKVDTVLLHDNVFSPSFLTTLSSCSTENIIISTYNKVDNMTQETSPFVLKDLNVNMNIFPINDDFDIALRELLDDENKLSDLEKQLNNLENKVTMIDLDLLLACSNKHNKDYFKIILDSIKNLKTNLLSELEKPTRRGFLGGGYYGFNKVKEKFFQSFYLKHENLRRLYDKTQHYLNLERQIKKDKLARNGIIDNLSYASNALVYTPSYAFNNYDFSKRQYNMSFLCSAEKSILNYSNKNYCENFFDNELERFFLSKFISCSLVDKGACIKELNYLPTGINYVDVLKCNRFNSSLERAFYEKLVFENSEYDLKDKVYNIDAIRKNAQEIDYSYFIKSKKIKIEKSYDINHNNVALTYKLKNTDTNKVCFDLVSTIPLTTGDRSTSSLSVSDDLEVNQSNFVNIESVSIYDKNNRSNIQLNTSCKTSIDIDYASFKVSEDDIRYTGTYIIIKKNFVLDSNQEDTFNINLRIERKKN